jgi:hypothetical protein
VKELFKQQTLKSDSNIEALAMMYDSSWETANLNLPIDDLDKQTAKQLIPGTSLYIFVESVPVFIKSSVQPIPAYMRLLFSKGIPYFLLPNLDSVNHCTSKYLFILISLLVQWLTESRFGKRK